MGLDYKINLYFEVERLEAALMAVAASARPPSQSVAVVLPTGRRLVLPFEQDEAFEHNTTDGDHIIRSGVMGVRLRSILRFATDEEIRKQLDKNYIGFDGPIVELGYIYLHIDAGQLYVELSFLAAYSRLSIMFERSPSIHRRFLDILQDAGGVVGIIDTERDEHFLLLADPKQVVNVNYWDFVTDDCTYIDVDGLMTALSVECDRLRGQAQDQPS